MMKFMDEIKKIDLSSASENIQDSQSATTKTMKKNSLFHLSKKKSGILLGALAVLGLFALLVIVGVLLPAQRVYTSARASYAQSKKVVDAIKKQNVADASVELAKTKIAVKKTQADLQVLSYLNSIPVVSWYYSDATHLISAGLDGINATEILVDSVKPYADVLGLKGSGSFVMGSAEQRIQTAVLTMGKITPRIDDIAKYLVSAKAEIDAVDPNHYPSFFGGEKVKKQLTMLQTLSDQGVVMVEQARPLIKVLPSLLGERKEKKYLILFQNDKELRPTGGFITAYAVFAVDKGIIHVDKSDDIYNLDNNLSKKLPVPEPIRTYLPDVKTFNLRDSNLSPDFVVSMDTFKSMYKNVSGKIDVDGIIALDTHVLVTTIKILDDQVQASGITFTTKHDDRCDCPQVIYELENNITRPVNYQTNTRKDLLGSLLYAIMQKALKSSPKLYWGPLIQNMFVEVNQKHVLFDLDDKDAQTGIEALNAAGRIKEFDGDYLHINEANFGGAKSNLYVKESVTQDAVLQKDGIIMKKITIQYKNPHPPSDCNLERGGLCLNATLRDLVRVYVPKGSVLVSSEGSQVKMKTYTELGKTVFEGFIEVRPLGAAKMTISYRLPFKLQSSSPLPLLIQKQPGTDNMLYTITVNGKQQASVELLTDKEFKLKH